MQLGQCQFCGHCERFICEANAKASPEVLLYPMLRKRKSFELRLETHVLDVLYDRKAKRVTGVRYIDRVTGEEYEQPADVIVLSSFTMSNTKFLLMAGIGTPYNPKTGHGVVGKNFCHQTMSGTRVFFKDRWINPFLASGASQTVIDEFNGDNFDHSGLGFFGGGYIYANVTNGRPIRAGLCRPARRNGARPGRRPTPIGMPTISPYPPTEAGIRIGRTMSTSTRPMSMPMVSRSCG